MYRTFKEMADAILKNEYGGLHVSQALIRACYRANALKLHLDSLNQQIEELSKQRVAIENDYHVAIRDENLFNKMSKVLSE